MAPRAVYQRERVGDSTTSLPTRHDESKYAWSSSNEKEVQEKQVDKKETTTFPKAVAGALVLNNDDLRRRITDILTNPNIKWKKAKTKYQLPPNYYDV